MENLFSFFILSQKHCITFLFILFIFLADFESYFIASWRWGEVILVIGHWCGSGGGLEVQCWHVDGYVVVGKRSCIITFLVHVKTVFNWNNLNQLSLAILLLLLRSMLRTNCTNSDNSTLRINFRCNSCWNQSSSRRFNFNLNLLVHFHLLIFILILHRLKLLFNFGNAILHISLTFNFLHSFVA